MRLLIHRPTSAFHTRWITMFLLCVSSAAFAQSHFDLVSGYGYYELVHLGASYNYSEKSSVGVYIGTNFGDDKKLFSAGTVYQHVFLKPLIWKLRPGFAIKGQYWSQNDENYFFSNISLLTNAVLRLDLNKQAWLAFEGGGVLNYNITSDRKQNTVAGSPTRANGNYAIAIHYRL